LAQVIVVKLLSENEFTAELVEPIFAEVVERVPFSARQQELNVPHVVAEWTSLMKAGVALTWAGKVGGKPVGLLGALFMKEFFTGRFMAMEQFWFVRGSHRKSGIGLRLFKAFEAEAARRGAETNWAGSNQWHDPELMDRLYKRLGYKRWGATYRKIT
jgi:GNAT superfamily N-acetyltransferase